MCKTMECKYIELDKAIKWLRENRDIKSHVDTTGFINIFKKAMLDEK